ncbi:DUF6216 family protein [Pantoea sp. GM01]|uniref:DUF6216 family protein n=1 Tax=Pantoea sp. GM01 TaxID=1144320 RepID=UPI000270DA31|nr:DUF6216 family protein [Pantoea sp. GM01]EJL88011.1 hypothetical protein PMI17_02769 [Pantoea sp. GM01]
MNVQADSGLFSKEGITIITSVLSVAIVILKSIINHLNKPIEGTDRLFKKAGLPRWLVRFFSIRVSIKKVPEVSHGGLIVLGIALSFFVFVTCFTSYFNVKLSKVPDGFTWLTFNATKEDFIISDKSASEVAFSPSWRITVTDCESGKSKELVDYGKISGLLHNYICDVLTDHIDQKQIKDSIEQFGRNHGKFTVLLLALSCLSLWFFISLLMTGIYTLKIRKIILKEHKDSFHYLT